MIQAGIDEAGYGPILGPLCVGLAAFRADSEDGPVDLWRRLRRAVQKTVPKRTTDRVPVADSKVLYQGGRLATLERTALAFSALSHHGIPPSTAGEWIDRHVAQRSRPRVSEYPWYADLEGLPIPLAAAPDGVRRSGAKLAAAADEAGVEMVTLRVAPLLEAEYSTWAERVNSKAVVLFDLNVRLIEDLRALSAEPLSVRCDRHGGRKQYQDVLSTAFPMMGVRTLREDDRSGSSYRVGHGAGSFGIEYISGAEQLGLEVALASVVAKYTRELFVEQMNRFFAGRVTPLRRTAGYYTDGLRFVADLDAVGALSETERRRILRSR